MVLTGPRIVLPVVCCFVLLVIVRESATEKPTFRIIAPEFICNSEQSQEFPVEDGSVNGTHQRNSSDTAPRQLTIGFQTNGGERLHYRVTTYFTLLDGFVSQRHTVGLWRAVRRLEQRVRRDRDQIADSGQLSVGPDELLPGVIYVFGVVGVAVDGSESDEENFTMTYRSREQGASFEHHGSAGSSDEVSLLLLGSEVSYADVEYSVTAQLIFCRRRADYFFRWSVDGLAESGPVAVSMERSNMLRLPAGSFAPGQTYNIQVWVHSSSGEQDVLTKAQMKVNILERQPSVALFPVEAIVGIDQPTQIRAHVSGGRRGDTRWTCQREGDSNVCDDTIDIGDDATVTFFRVGQYFITASIGNGSGMTGGSNLSVHPKVTPSVRLLELSQYPAVSGAPFRLLVSVAGLVPKCRSNWTVLKEKGFAYFDPMQIPGAEGILGGFYIRDIEENFLSELVDYGNDTIVKESALLIPGANGERLWKGLEPDVRYKIRLETVCPEPIDDSQVGAQRQRQLVASHWTFELETNGAPREAQVEVTPDGNGTALETVFRIVSAIAKDSASDYPLRYSFWYVADGIDINVGAFYEITSVETVLPYTQTGTVSTYVVVCDSREACSKTNGPDVRVLPGSEPSDGDITFALESIQSFFDRLNLREALKTAFELLVTLRNRNSPLYDGTYRRFVDLFQQAVAHIGKVYGETAYLSEATIQQFIMQAKPILDLEESSNHDLFQQLLELMDSPPSARGAVQRRKRSGTQPQTLSSAGKINAKLYLMEGMTASSNATVARRSRLALLNYVHQATKSYCSIEPHHVHVGQLITLEVNRYRSLSEVNLQRLQIPNKVHLSTPIGRSQFTDGFPETEYFCVGRIYYARDLFVDRAVHELDLGFYEVFLLSIDKGGIWTLMNWKGDYFLWSLDGRQLPNVTCQLWEGDAWSRRSCITTETSTDQVFCNCTRIGYLRLSNETEPDEHTTASSENFSPVDVTTLSNKSSEVPSEGTTLWRPESTPDAGSVATELSTTTPHSTGSRPLGTTLGVESATESDMITLPSRAEMSTISPAESFSQQPSFNVTENGPSPLQAESGKNASTEPLHNRPMKASSIAYTIVAALLISTLLMALLTVAYRRRRSVLCLADELHTVPLNRARTQSPHVRYARFQDEHTMAGDNVSTISDGLTT